MADEDAKATLAALRAQIDELTAPMERLRFDQRAAKGLESRKQELFEMARDFRARAAAASGTALRELLRLWLANGVVDKEKRTVALTIRRVPEHMRLSSAPESVEETDVESATGRSGPGAYLARFVASCLTGCVRNTGPLGDSGR